MRKNGFADKPDTGIEQFIPPRVGPFARSFRALLQVRNVLKMVSFIQVGIDEFRAAFNNAAGCQSAVKRGFARAVRAGQEVKKGLTQWLKQLLVAGRPADDFLQQWCGYLLVKPRCCWLQAPAA